MGTNDWPIPTNANDVFRNNEKRLTHEERRPQITKASDLMGPGLAPYAVESFDLSDDASAFNGFFYIDVGALESPNDTKKWMGQTIAVIEGSGVQIFHTFQNVDAPAMAKRSFETFVEGGTRVYSDWVIT